MKRTLLAAALCAVRTMAGAADYHVHADGDDRNPGTPARPWKTLERAGAAALAPGDRILLARGSTFTGTLTLRASGSAAAPIVVSAYGKGPAPRLTNPYFAEHDGHIVEVFGRHVVVENLYLYDTPTPPPDPQPTRWQDSAQHRNVTRMAAVFVDRDASHVTVRENEFANALVGVRLRGTHSAVRNNHFHDAAKITEQWGAIAVSVVGPDNEVAYNLVENYGFYGGAYVTDGAAVELDGEDPDYRAHHVHIHHNVSHNVKGGFLEIAGRSHDVLVDHNLSDDVDKFVGGTHVRNVEIRNNTVLRTRLPHIPKEAQFPLATVFWSFNDKDDDEFHVTRNLFVLDAAQRVYKGPDHKLGITPVTQAGNQYFSPNGDIATVLQRPLAAGETVAAPRFADAARGDYRQRGAAARATPYAGAYPPGQPAWKAGLTRARD
jgi:hypothetical protein